MSSYIHFTDEQKEQAHQTDIVSLLKSQGEAVKRSGKEYEWFDGTQKVTVRGNLWYHQYERVGGDAVSFVRKFYNKNYVEAVQFLLDETYGQLVRSQPIVKKKSRSYYRPRMKTIQGLKPIFSIQEVLMKMYTTLLRTKV